MLVWISSKGLKRNIWPMFNYSLHLQNVTAMFVRHTYTGNTQTQLWSDLSVGNHLMIIQL